MLALLALPNVKLQKVIQSVQAIGGQPLTQPEIEFETMVNRDQLRIAVI